MADGRVPPITVAMTVNGTAAVVDVEPSESLASTLRNRLGLTGTKLSCDVQACGACTVLVDGLPRSSCTFLTYEARDREVVTVEGLATDGVLGVVQEAFIADSAFQCGFCTPGMLLSAHAYLHGDGSREADDDLLEYMSGNLCRCTGYLPIVAALLRAGRALASEAGGAAPGGATRAAQPARRRG
jgi:aerobic-type carbon monoxide dehydrogenase small subunit (CoxS/CutS family)